MTDPDIPNPQSELSERELNDLAARKLIGAELRAMRCYGLAKTVELGVDLNPRIVASVRAIKKLAGLA